MFLTIILSLAFVIELIIIMVIHYQHNTVIAERLKWIDIQNSLAQMSQFIDDNQGMFSHIFKFPDKEEI